MKPATQLIGRILLVSIFIGCQPKAKEQNTEQKSIRVIFDTDTNNELDDQHALAYLAFNQDVFNIEAITVNATFNGGDIEEQYKEAERVLKLCRAESLPLLKGANKSFEEILPTISQPNFDGVDAVNFMIEKSHETTDTLMIIAVGKLTTVALAVAKEPSFASRVKLVWLGSNYPDPGEYNQDNDTIAMNYLLNSPIHFQMVTVRGGKGSGTAAVKITKEEANSMMPGLGPRITSPITGRHGGEFYCFGDYSVNLFEHIDYYGDPPSRALFDMAAVAIVKNPLWAESYTVPAPILIQNQWIERPGNARKIVVWENFDRDAIIEDFASTLRTAGEK
jgi:purine nucleosidase